MSTAFEVFKNFKDHLETDAASKAANSWKALEADTHLKHSKILEKGPFKVDNRYVLYVTDDKSEFDMRKLSYPDHIVYSDRENVPVMNKVDGTLSLHMVQSMDNQGTDRQLSIANFPCRCLSCRGKATPGSECKFIELRNERAEIVRQGAERSPMLLDTDEQEQELLNRLQQFGLQKTRVADLKLYLQAGGKSTTGRRKELAQRALEMDVPPITEENRPLAALLVDEEVEEQVDEEDTGDSNE